MNRIDTSLGWRLRRAAAIADGLLLPLYTRRTDVNATQLVYLAARHSSAPFTFVQVGSNDGISQGDPLSPTVKSRPTRGLLIEPVPELFERLKLTYAGKGDLTYIPVAVAEDNGSREFYWVPPIPGDPVWVEGLGSFSREVILSHATLIPGIAGRIKAITVQCRTLSSLIQEHGLTRIDLLHIDAEGSDLMILKTVDFHASWSPRCILYEQRHLGPDWINAQAESETEKASSALALLRSTGYHTVDLGRDVFAFRGIAERTAYILRSLSRSTMRVVLR